VLEQKKNEKKNKKKKYQKEWQPTDLNQAVLYMGFPYGTQGLVTVYTMVAVTFAATCF